MSSRASLQTANSPLAGLAVACFVLLSACGGETDAADAPLRFTAIPGENTTEMAAKFQPVAEYLSEALGVEVEYVPSSSYPASVEMFKNGDVQLAWFGGLSGVRARRAVPGSQALAQGAEDPEYKSYFIAHRDTGLEPSATFPAELAELSFTFGSESSTSGRMMPEHFIRESTGSDPATFFGRPMRFSGSHDLTLEEVGNGTVDAGVLSYKTYELRAEEGRVDPEVVRVVWETPTYADYNWTASPRAELWLGEGAFEELGAALFAMDDPALLGAVNRSALIPASNADFAELEALALELELVR